MNATATIPATDTAAALRRLLGDCPVITPEALATFGTWLLSVLKEENRSLLSEGGQQWARAGQLAMRFGCRRSQMSAWLAALRAEGTVRVCRPHLPDGTESHHYYNIADIERAWLLARPEPATNGNTTTAAATATRPAEYPYRRHTSSALPPEQQRGLAAMEALKARIAAQNS